MFKSPRSDDIAYNGKPPSDLVSVETTVEWGHLFPLIFLHHRHKADGIEPLKVTFSFWPTTMGGGHAYPVLSCRIQRIMTSLHIRGLPGL